MNSGAEAVETAIKAVRKWGYEVKGVPAGPGRDHRLREQLPRPHPRRSCPSRPTPTPAAASARSCRASASSPSATPTRSRPRSPRTPSASSSSRSRARPASSSRPPATSPASASSASTHGVTLILDEIQTGLGRTGKLLAEEHEGIEADVTLIGKALGGGFYPISAVLSNSDVLGVLKPGQHGSTFGGNPLACAVARAALKVLVEEGMIERSAELGAYFKAGLEAIRSNRVAEVRGRGLMLAVEIHPDAGPARPVVEALRAARHPRQGDPRPDHPPLAAARHRARRDRLGAGAHRGGAALRPPPPPRRPGGSLQKPEPRTAFTRARSGGRNMA